MGKELQLSNNLDEITKEIIEFQKVTGQAIFEIGRRLKHVKENDLVHGEWTNYCTHKINMDRAQADKFIRVYKELGHEFTYTHLGLNALYQIAAMPKEIREQKHEVNGRVKTVDQMTVRELREVNRKTNKETKNTNTPKSKVKDEPQVIEKEVYIEKIPDDYDLFKGKAENLEGVVETYKQQNKDLRKELKDLEKIIKSERNQRDFFSSQLAKLDSNLHGKLRNLKFYGELDIAHWLSRFTKEKQKQIEELELTSEFIVTFSENNSFYNEYIRNTPISGQQLNRLIQLQWKNDQSGILKKVSFYGDGEFHSKLDKAKTTFEIDNVLDEFEQKIAQANEQKEYTNQKETEYTNSNFNDFDWSGLFGNLSSQSYIDHRKELGLASTATDKEVKKAYRDLLKTLHPDTGGVNNTIFQKYKEMFDDWKKTTRNKAS